MRNELRRKVRYFEISMTSYHNSHKNDGKGRLNGSENISSSGFLISYSGEGNGILLKADRFSWISLNDIVC